MPNVVKPLRQFVEDFFELEASAGIILVGSALLAMIVANTPLVAFYNMLIDIPVAVRFGALEIAKPLLLWINDGLMAVFFLLIGLEVKREVLEGELSRADQIALPAIGAIGGMIFPAMIYTWLNRGDPVAMQGWAIPAATDIAFALGVLALLGDRVPLGLKVLLVSIAIFDDLGAIIIIALFYTDNVSPMALLLAAALMVPMFIMNRRGVTSVAPYLLFGGIMWIAVLKSGVHATLAGVVTAMFIPMRDPADRERSPLKSLESDLHTGVAYIILPVFAFANAGISLAGASADYLMHGVPLGIAAGLFVGKQVGIFGLCSLAVMTGLVRLPEGVNMKALYGVSLLCGIGFTMSLFIGSLAFEATAVNRSFDERLGIIAGSLISGVLGYLVLRFSLRAPADAT